MTESEYITQVNDIQCKNITLQLMVEKDEAKREALLRELWAIGDKYDENHEERTNYILDAYHRRVRKG